MSRVATVVEAIPLLTSDEARQVVRDVHAERAHWHTRDATTEFHTLGAASYIDARERQFGAYQEYARRMNPVLSARFGWLLDKLRSAIASAVGGDVRYDDQLALPGFHIFLYHPEYWWSKASVHYDLQYELVDWSRIGTPDISSQLSLTLALSLPESGGGLLVWNINRLDVVRLSPEDRLAHMRANRVAALHPYTIGAVALHSGHQLHQIAPTQDPQPADERITLQAHTLRVDGVWVMYW